jgi:two-component system sensor histidine kinase/response regulator
MRAISILIVDDKLENLVALEELLRRVDREVFKATTGNDALRLMLRHDFAVVLLDVEMPGMDGYEIAELMRSAERTKLVPIIFVTAGDRSEERMFRGYAAGAVDYLYKPLSSRVLQSKVDVFVDIYRKTRELEVANNALARTSNALRERIVDLENVSRTLSHDLRAPLRSIRSFSTSLADTLAGTLEPEAQDSLDRLVRASERMAHMVDDLFALLQLSAVDHLATEISVRSVLEDVIENLRLDLTQAGGAVTYDDLPMVRAHASLLSQILQNLVGNALKFRGPRAPRVHVGAQPIAGAWLLAVTDNGVGIPAEHRERVFGLFERLGGEAAGTGVGLALTRRAVEKLHGRIWVDAARDGGAVFYFTIPR